MPIEVKREGHTCEKCKKSDTEVGKIIHYTKHGDDLLLCPKCLKFRERPYTEICPKCKRIAYKHGGLTYYDDSDIDDSNDYVITDDNEDFDNFDYNEEPPSSSELMCLECHEKKVARERKRKARNLKIKNFAKNHWKFWISTGLIITGLVIAYFSFLATK